MVPTCEIEIAVSEDKGVNWEGGIRVPGIFFGRERFLRERPSKRRVAS